MFFNYVHFYLVTKIHHQNSSFTSLPCSVLKLPTLRINIFVMSQRATMWIRHLVLLQELQTFFDFVIFWGFFFFYCLLPHRWTNTTIKPRGGKNIGKRFTIKLFQIFFQIIIIIIIIMIR